MWESVPGAVAATLALGFAIVVISTLFMRAAIVRAEQELSLPMRIFDHWAKQSSDFDRAMTEWQRGLALVERAFQMMEESVKEAQFARAEMETANLVFKEATEHIRRIRTEIENIQHELQLLIAAIRSAQNGKRQQ